MPNELTTLFGKRLQQARKMRGLSLAELRGKIGEIVSIAALSKYEKGQAMASSKILVALSEGLDVSVDYLFRDFEVSLDRFRFRKQSTLSKKELESVQEKSRDFFERYFEIEEIVGATHTYKPVFKADQAVDIEYMAQVVRKEWGIGNDPIPNVHALLEDNGIKVWFSKDCDEKFNGFSATTNRGPVAVISKNMTPARQRMTALHEIAHILLEPLNLDLAVEEKEIVPGFTGALLLPAEPLIEMLGNKRKSIPTGELLEIKKRYGVAMSAVMMRARDAKIITDQTCANFFRFGPAKNWRTKETRKEPGDDQLGAIFPETNFRFKQLVFRAYGEELITISQAADYLKCSVGEAYKQLNDPF